MDLDKARWHLEGEFPSHLDPHQAYVYGGLFLAWLCIRELLAADVVRDFTDECALCRARKITGPDLYEQIGGVLSSEMLRCDVRPFATWYFGLAGVPPNIADPPYLRDYLSTLRPGPGILEYEVPDTWDTFDRLRPAIDSSYEQRRG